MKKNKPPIKMKINLFLLLQIGNPIAIFLLFIGSALAIDLDLGETIFQTNCNVCHIGGNNVIIPEKNLKITTLKMNGMDKVEAIMYQVTNGKNGMPAFGSRLTEEEIKAVANYILDQNFSI